MGSGLAVIVAAGGIGDTGVALDTVGRLLGRLHPSVVHFPIALIVTAGLVELLASIRRDARASPLALLCLLIGAAGAVVAAWFGWLNAAFEPLGAAEARTLLLHRWIGVTVAALAVVGLLLGGINRARRSHWTRSGYRASLAAAVMLVLVGGHLGGTLVYGEGYVLEVLRRRPDAVEATAGMPSPVSPVRAPGAAGAAALVDFQRDIEPVLEDRCWHCHGPKRQRAELRLDRPDGLFEGDGGSGVIRPGSAAASAVFQRISLPADHADRMPARGDPLTARQIALIGEWIDQGALWGPSPAREVEVVSAVPPPEPGLSEAGRARRDEALEAIRTRGGLALPIAADTDAVDVNFSLAPDVTDADLSLLRGLESTLQWLNLARTQVSDEGLAVLSEFRELSRLRLDQTRVTDDGLAHLSGLPRLEYLNLYRTEVTDDGLRHLAGLRRLRRLYLWRTGVTRQGQAELRAALPELTIVGVAATADQTTETAADRDSSDPEPEPGQKDE